MTNRSSPASESAADGLWHVALDGWVRHKMLGALHRAAVAVKEWHELPLWAHAKPGVNVDLRSELDKDHVSKIGLHLRENRLAISGYVSVQIPGWTFHISEDSVLMDPLASLADRSAIADRIRLWIDRIELAPKQDEKLVEWHRQQLEWLVTGAAHVTLPDWAGLTFEPYLVGTMPRLWEEDWHPSNSADPIEYHCSNQLMDALLEARDPFVHVRQDMRYGSHIGIWVGGAEPITVRNTGDPVSIMRIAGRLPAGAAIFL